MIRSLVRILLRLLYGLRTENERVLSAPGPVILAPNHVSWLDWLFLGACLGEDWKFVTSKATAQSTWLHRRIMVNRRTFPIDPTSAYAVREMATFLEGGGKLVLFPEGRITRTAGLMKLYDGCGFLLHKTKATVIFTYLRGAVRVPWVRHSGYTLWFPRVSIHFSDRRQAPSHGEASPAVVRTRLVQWMRDQMVAQQFETEQRWGPADLVHGLAARAALQPKREVLEDVTGAALTYRRILVGGDVLAKCWSRLPAEGPVGVLLPNVNATPLVLLSLWRAGRVPAVLNFSIGVDGIRGCCELAGIRTVITSRLFLEKAKLDEGRLVQGGLRLEFLEDVRASISTAAKLLTLVRHTLSTGWGWKNQRINPTDTAVILFTSGSEGRPKGVELSHANILANLRQIAAVMDVTEADSVLNALPLFHSFGLVAGTFYPLLLGARVYLYPSPLHYRTIPAFCYDRACTVLLGTNTFLNGYARKAHPYDFATLRFVIAGAEKVQTSTVDEWSRRFGVRILEGYGATECSPVVAVNSRVATKLGAAGRLLPGIEYRLEPVEGVAEGGRLWVRGPNIMKGYINPDAQAKFAEGQGWYDTGDMATVDEEGFLHLKGRLKRFAKVSGEMVSLTAVEEALAIAISARNPRAGVAVLAVPDEDKGERLVAVTTERSIRLPELRQAVRAAGLSNLCAPREVRFLPSLPKLGTGKADYRALAGKLEEAELLL